MKKYDIEVKVLYKVYRNKETGWSIYAVKPTDPNHDLKLNSFNNVTIKGETRPLEKGEIYNLSLYGPIPDPRYGDGYEITWVEQETLDTMEKQDAYLQSLLTEKQFRSLKEAYPNEMLVDLITADKVDVTKLNGIKEKTLVKIKEKLSSNSHIAVLIACLSDLELSTKKIEKIVQHFDSPDEAAQAIKDNIYVLCDIKSFGFKTIDKIAMQRGDIPTNSNRIKACLEYILGEESSEGHTWSQKSEIINKAEELLTIKPAIIEEAILKIKTVREHDGRLMLTHIIAQEALIAAHLKRISESYETVDNLDEKVEYQIHQVEEAQGFMFTEEQRHAIKDGMRHGVMVLDGKAGTGKSASVKGLLDVLKTENYMTCGLSGKSAQVLSQRGIISSTIHRMLGYKDGNFMFNEENQLPFSAVVVDEVSMVNVSLLLSVLRAIPDGCKLILVGDSGQLPAIGFGDVLRDLLRTERYPVYRLTKVHRQAAKSGILSLGNSVRDGNKVVKYNSSGREIYGELQDQVVLSVASDQKDTIPHMVINIAKEYQSKIKQCEDLFDFQVLLANKERGNLSVRNLNLHMQEIFNDMSKPFLLRNGYGFRQGDKIITHGNSYSKRYYTDLDDYNIWYDADRKTDSSLREKVDVEEEEMDMYNSRGNITNIFNGTMGYVYHIDLIRKVALIKFENNENLLPYTQEEMEKLDMAYAITVHKSQGSSFKDVVFAIDFGAYKLLTRQLIYTGLTRASRKGALLVENNALYQAIQTDASGTRRTTLGEIFEREMLLNGGAEID